MKLIFKKKGKYRNAEMPVMVSEEEAGKKVYEVEKSSALYFIESGVAKVASSEEAKSPPKHGKVKSSTVKTAVKKEDGGA